MSGVSTKKLKSYSFVHDAERGKKKKKVQVAYATMLICPSSSFVNYAILCLMCKCVCLCLYVCGH